eukprot:TRINITY_DN1766_c0_g1_i2.p1 TRINITY_DN1766_c0_g1~~TRINITY_DN1766_c0_g1_i2.p1  ORF type:complete len:173 (+),score=44.67 TRINITY_DN1766_c0_g1_i2:118-636(+)
MVSQFSRLCGLCAACLLLASCTLLPESAGACQGGSCQVQEDVTDDDAPTLLQVTKSHTSSTEQSMGKQGLEDLEDLALATDEDEDEQVAREAAQGQSSDKAHFWGRRRRRRRRGGKGGRQSTVEEADFDDAPSVLQSKNSHKSTDEHEQSMGKQNLEDRDNLDLAEDADKEK